MLLFAHLMARDVDFCKEFIQSKYFMQGFVVSVFSCSSTMEAPWVYHPPEIVVFLISIFSLILVLSPVIAFIITLTVNFASQGP